MPRARVSLLAPLAIVSSVLLAGCASYQGIAPAEFASIACSTWLEDDSLDEIQSSEHIDSLTGTGEEQLAQAIAAAEGVVTAWEAKREVFSGATPAVEDGKSIVDLFVDYYTIRIDASRELIDEFASTPTDAGDDGSAVAGAAEALGYAIGDTEADADWPFLKIDDQKIVEAMLADDVCSTFLDERGW